MTEDELLQQKQIQLFACGVNGFVALRLEVDKSILALSAGGIGLLITLLTTVGPTSVCVLVIDLLAALAFILTIVVVLIVLWIGSDQLKSAALLVTVPDHMGLEYLVRFAFGTGVLLTCIAGGITGYAKLQQGDSEMGRESKVVIPENQRGMSGIGGLIPKPASSQPATLPANTPAPAPSTTPTPTK